MSYETKSILQIKSTDQMLMEYKDLVEMLALAGEIVKNPKQTVTQFYDGIKNLNSDQIQEIINQFASDIEADITNIALGNEEGQYHRGRGAVSVAITVYKVAAGGGFLFIVKEVDGFTKLFKGFNDSVREKLNNLPDGKAKKFDDDFTGKNPQSPDDNFIPDEVAQRINNPDMIDFWDGLGDHDVRKNIGFLEIAVGLTPDQKLELIDMYKPGNFIGFKGNSRNINYPANKKVNVFGDVTVEYDEFGMAKFIPLSPRAAEFKITESELLNYGLPPTGLSGTGPPDFTACNNWAKNHFGEDDFLPVFDANGIQSTSCLIKIPVTVNGQTEIKFVKHTWHHHQDGRTLYPVPFDIHSKFAHTATTVIGRGLQDVFPAPEF